MVMTATTRFFAFVFLLLGTPLFTLNCARADPVFACGDTGAATPTPICADRELVGLGKAVDARLKSVLAQADSLTALLLRRDQAWFEDILLGEDTPRFAGQDNPERQRLKHVLEQRLATLGAIKPRAIAATPAGSWANALAAVTATEAGGEALAVTFTARLVYQGREALTCDLAGSFKADQTGWFAGALAAADGTQAKARLRLQGSTLRLVYAGESDPPPSVCGPLRIITGSYFPMAPAHKGAPVAVAAGTVSPSFKCEAAENSDEVETCADPELASRDTQIARVYTQTLQRLPPRVAAQLRADERGWAKNNPTAYDAALHWPGNKENYMLHDTEGAREELMRRLDERLAMLVNLDEKRKGLMGLWEAYNAVVTVVPAKDKDGGPLIADGFKWVVGDRKEFCVFKSAGRLEGATFKPAEEFPTLTRDGPTLVTSIEAPDHDAMPAGGPPGYCNNMRSAKARLFPVKPAAGEGAKFDRQR